MPAPAEASFRRLLQLIWTLFALVVLWRFLPLIQRYLIGLTAAPREVTARGELAADERTTIEHLIQTDAAINPGNSGGPLLDSAGRLIGINTAIYSPSGAYAGIGFAAPVDAVNSVVPRLIARGKYQRPSLGISVDDDINRALAEKLDIEGVLILKVQPGSAAEKAGLRGTRMGRGGEVTPGDVIQAVEGRPVTGVKELFSLLDQYRIGDQVKLRIWRDGRVAEATVVLQGEAR